MNETLSTGSIEGMSAEEKRALLKRLLAEQEAGSPVWPLTMGQKALWYLYRLQPDDPSYNTGFALRITSGVHIPALQNALKRIYARHPELGARFELQGDTPVCRPAIADPELIICPAGEIPADLLDTRLLEAYRQPFRLEEGKVSRCYLFSTGPEAHIFLFSIHHIVYDDGATSIIIRELLQGYQEEIGLPVPALSAQEPVPFGQYALQEQQLLNSEKGAALRRYWQEQLALMPDMPALMAYKVPEQGAGELRFTIAATRYAAVKEHARREGVTVFSWLMAVFQLLLHRYSGQAAVTTGIPVSGRDNMAYAQTVGYFVNLLPVCTNLAPGQSFRDYLKTVVAAFGRAFACKDLPFAAMAALPGVGKLEDKVPVVFNYLSHSAGIATLLQPLLQPGGLSFTEYHLPSQEGAFELTFELKDQGDWLEGSCKFRKDRYEPGFITAFCALYDDYLEQTLQPAAASQLPAPRVLAAEQALVEAWNNTGNGYTGSMVVPQAFAETAAHYRQLVAVSGAGQELTYGELDAQSAQLARYLQEEQVQKGARVALLLSRNVEMIVSILGVLRAGAVYVPVDSSYPAERIRQMLETAGCEWLICDTEPPENAVPANMRYIRPGTREYIHTLPPQCWQPPLASDDPACIMFTSGSTGQPKGVVVNHGNIVNLVKENRYIRVAATDRFMLVSNYVFDGSTFEIFGALLNGARLYMPAEEVIFNAAAFTGFIADNGINTAFLATAFFNRLVEYDPAFVRYFDHLFFGGETVSLPHVQRAFPHCKKPGALVHVYGPTECTTFSTWYPLTTLKAGARQLPIGRPLSNVQIYVLDEQLTPVPIGVNGQLYIGGKGVAAGYMGEQGQRFISAPWNTAERLYATGDHGCWLPDGNIHFTGRKDQQLKFRGYRIEPGEIAAALCRHAAVQQAQALLYTDAAGNSRLLAFAATGTQEPSPQELKDFLAACLPHYMVPADCYCLPQLPLNLNGKIDNKALLRLAAQEAQAAAGQAPPETPLQQLVAGIWQQVLGKQVGIYDNFFALGGHSLLAGRACAQITAATGTEMPLGVFIREPTIAAVSRYLEQAAVTPAAGTTAAIAITKADREKYRRSQRHNPIK